MADRDQATPRAADECSSKRSPSAEERKVWAILEKARQDVKALAKRELEADEVTEQLLSIRLR